MLHVKKLCVGVESLDQLRRYQQQRQTLIHDTRHFPKRSNEILAGGSLFWIIKGYFAVRQPILELQHLANDEAGSFCRIIYSHEMITVRADKHLPFQGWRYLTVDNAPPDTHKDIAGQPLPSELAAELDQLGIPARYSTVSQHS